MVYKVGTDKQRYYHQVLKLLRNFSPFNKLVDRELELLAELLSQREKIIEQNVTDPILREAILFSYEKKQEIYTKLGMSDASFRNALSGLRKKGFLNKHTIILPVSLPYLTEVIVSFVEPQTIENVQRI